MTGLMIFCETEESNDGDKTPETQVTRIEVNRKNKEGGGRDTGLPDWIFLVFNGQERSLVSGVDDGSGGGRVLG